MTLSKGQWRRAALVLSVAWVAGVWAFSEPATAAYARFYWFDTMGNWGPALRCAIAGVVAIVAVCLGVPWITESRAPKASRE